MTGTKSGITVLQLLGLHPNKLGGFEDYILAFATRMHEIGHCTVFTFEGEPHSYIKEKLNEIDSRYYVCDKPNGLYGYFLFIYRVIGIIRKYRPDIIQGQFHPESHLAPVIGSLARIPAYITVHSTTSQHQQAVKLPTIIKAKISSFLSRGVFAVSDAVRKDLTDNLHTTSKNIMILHNGVNLNRYNPVENDCSLHKELGISENSKIALTIAHARYEKGLEYLIKAVPDIIGKEQNSHFVFCGGGPDESSLINLARELGVNEHVHFLGRRDDIPRLLNCSYMSVLPSIAEPFGLAVVEAMAMRKPVVATRVDGVPEVVVDGETGILVNPRDSRSLSGAIISLLGNNEQARLMGEEGRKRVEKCFDLNTRVSKEIAIYEDYQNSR